MTFFPLRKRSFSLPYPAETVVDRLRELKDYDVTINGSAFRMRCHLLVESAEAFPLFHGILQNDFKGELQEQGDSVQITLKPTTISIARLVISSIIVVITLVTALTFLFNMLKEGFDYGFLLRFPAAFFFYGIFYFSHFVQLLYQVNDLKKFLTQEVQKTE